ncbi:MAG: response regulator [Gammaproteobacteria bacterium]|nr:response regulator [Gammaproteobacteria bacterium]
MKRLAPKFEYILRYFYGMMAISVTAAIVALGALYLVEEDESRTRDRVLFFHLKAAEETELIYREYRSLLPSASAGFSDNLKPGSFSTNDTPSLPRPDVQGTLRDMWSHVERLRELHVRFDGEDFFATLQRVTDRLAKMVDSVANSPQPVLSENDLLMLGRGLEQLKRQHDIAIADALGSLDVIADRSFPFLAIVTLLVTITGLVTWFSVRQMRVSMLRQADIEQALSDSQERMHHMQKLEALGQLVGGVAHDFNNLLTAILGHASLLLDKSSNGDPTRLSASQIRQAAEQAATLTRQLLAFSRNEPAEVQVFNLNELICEMDDMLRRLIGEDIELDTHYADKLNPVELDPGQMRQVILNLVVNARDAMPDGGRISIITGNTSSASSNAGGGTNSSHPEAAHRQVKLVVADTGMGMDSDTCSRIFEPYFTTKEKGRGTGLGLSTVHGIVTAAGGNISVSSLPGNGSRFEILLPASKDISATPVAKEQRADNISGCENVLIVEDEEQIRTLLEKGLARLGYHVLTAPDARSGLEICKNNSDPIDVIVSDVIMPHTNGAEFLNEARQYQPSAAGIFMSGYTDDILQKSGTTLSDIPLLTKPFEIGVLATLIRTSIAERKTS